MAYMVNIINLRKGQIYHLKPADRRGRRLQVLSGTGWATLSGHSEDFVLKQGESLSANEDLLLESLTSDLSFSLESSV